MTHRNFGIPPREGFHIQYSSVDWFIPTWGVYALAVFWIVVIVMLVAAYA